MLPRNAPRGSGGPRLLQRRAAVLVSPRYLSVPPSLWGSPSILPARSPAALGRPRLLVTPRAGKHCHRALLPWMQPPPIAPHRFGLPQTHSRVSAPPLSPPQFWGPTTRPGSGGGVSQGVGDDCVAEAVSAPGRCLPTCLPLTSWVLLVFFFFLLPRELQICLRFAVIWPRVLLGRPEQPAAGCGPTAGGRRGGCEGSGCSATIPSAATPGSLGIPSATVPGSSSSPRCRCPQ